MSKSTAPVTMWVNLNGGESQPSFRMEVSRSEKTPENEKNVFESPKRAEEEEEYHRKLASRSPPVSTLDFIALPQTPKRNRTPKKSTPETRLTKKQWENSQTFMAAKERNCQLEQQLDKVQEEVQKLQNTKELFNRLQTDFEDIQKKNTQLHEERQEWLETFAKQETDMEERSEKQKEEIDRLSKDTDMYKTQVDELREQESKFLILQKQHNTLVGEMKSKCSQLVEVQQELTSHRSKSKETISKLQTELANVQTCEERIREEMQSLQQRHRQHEKELQTTLTSTQEQAQSAIEKLERENEKISSDFNGAKTQVQDLEKRIMAIQSNLEAATRECDILIETKTMLTNDISQLKKTVKSKGEKLEELSTENTHLLTSNGHLKESTTKLSSECQAMQRLLEYKKNKEAEVAGNTPQRQVVKRETREKEDLLRKLNDMQAELIESRQALWSLEQQNEALRDRCNYIELDRDRIQLLLIQVRDELERQLGKARRKASSRDERPTGCGCCVM